MVGRPDAAGGLVESVAGYMWPATIRERMRALIAEDPEEAPLEVLRRLREEGHRLGRCDMSEVVE